MNLIRALYEHCLIKPPQKGKLWIFRGMSWTELKTGFKSIDGEVYYIVSDNERPSGFVFPFNLFIKDEYEK